MPTKFSVVVVVMVVLVMIMVVVIMILVRVVHLIALDQGGQLFAGHLLVSRGAEA